MLAEAPVTAVELHCYTVPTRSFGEAMPESDGTLRWDSTSMLLVRLSSGGVSGLGYAYASPASLDIVRDALCGIVLGSDALEVTGTFWRMARAVRNLGWAGVCAGAISAVDAALHDLRARLFDVSLNALLGAADRSVAAYGSGGFTSYTDAQLSEQLGGWAEAGFGAVKLKIGTEPHADLHRVEVAREAVGAETDLFVDANGAYHEKQALWFAERFAELGVTWFEEPVTSDDRAALARLRTRVPGGMRIAAGEYGYTPAYFTDLLSASAVDVMQADATRCGGPTGFLLAAAQARAANVPFSAHTAPALHGVLATAVPGAINVEYFHDHALIEDVFFEGLPALKEGRLVPDRRRPGNGLELKGADARPYLTAEWRSA